MLFHALFSNEFDGTPPCYIMHAFSYKPQSPKLFLSITSETVSKVYFGQTFKYPNFGDNSILAKLDHALSNIITTPLSLIITHAHPWG
jgi:hypothetical protein